MVNQATLRLQKEYKALLRGPVPDVQAHPSPSNILEWHYVLQGGGESPYEGGFYHGKIMFPEQYPFKPPAICMITPNGRFTPNTRLCLSMSDFHPESWNPMWSVSTILAGLLSFMVEEVATTGSITISKEERKRLAHESVTWNLSRPLFHKMFPSLVPKLQAIAAERQKLEDRERLSRGLKVPEHSKTTAEGKDKSEQVAQVPDVWDWMSTLGSGMLLCLLLAVMCVPLLNLDSA